MIKAIKVLLLGTAMIYLSGCANDLTGYNYSRDSVRQMQSVSYGRIARIQIVKIEGMRNGAGSLGGALAGGLAGSTVGKGGGHLLGAIGGAAIGGIAGNAIEKSATRDGVNLFVKLCSGKTISVVQQVDKYNTLREGDPVAVLSNGYETRVTYDPEANCQEGNVKPRQMKHQWPDAT